MHARQMLAFGQKNLGIQRASFPEPFSKESVDEIGDVGGDEQLTDATKDEIGLISC